MKTVITIIGSDRIGIVAAVTAILADKNVNILDINQNIVNGIFNMILIGDMEKASVDIRELQKLLKETGDKIGLEIKAQHENIFSAMHRV